MVSSVVFSHKSDVWQTPKDLFEALNAHYKFIYDLACTSKNKLAKKGFCIDKGQDGLRSEWPKDGWLFLNPPYSQNKEWMKKVAEEHKKGAKIVCLLPSRTDTQWFHDFVYNKENVRIMFLRGRLKFGGKADKQMSAPFPSMIVEYG